MDIYCLDLRLIHQFCLRNCGFWVLQ